MVPISSPKSALAGVLAGLLLPSAATAALSPPNSAPTTKPAATAADARTPATVTRSGNEIRVTCNQPLDVHCAILSATVNSVKRELSAPDAAKVDTLVIESTGGDFDPTMELGRLIHARNLAIKIDTACTFGCSVFLVPATERLIVPKGSFLVYFPLLSLEKQAFPGIEKQLSAKIGEEKAKTAVQAVLDRQNSYLRELDVDPDVAFGLGESDLLLKAALAGEGDADEPVVVPDAAYLQKCLGVKSVDMQPYTVEDSKTQSHHGKVALAYLIDGKIYFDGKPVADYHPTCSAG